MTEFKLLPVVPTEAMIYAGVQSDDNQTGYERVKWIYTHMLAAAQAHDGEAVHDVMLAEIIQNETGCADSDSLSAAWAVQEAYSKHTAPPRVVDDELRLLMQNALESLQGYRREMNDPQPCDAEKALQSELEKPCLSA